MSGIRRRIESAERRANIFHPAPPGAPVKFMSEAQLVHLMTGGRRTTLTEDEYRALERLPRDAAGTPDAEALRRWAAGLP